jgi:hypothetical protein
MMRLEEPHRYKRTELIALMNLLHKLSESLLFYDYFETYERDVVLPQYHTFKLLMSGFLFFTTLLTLNFSLKRLQAYLRKRKLSSKLD